eukprot:5604265-Pyramimonas_sp.AAC.1
MGACQPSDEYTRAIKTRERIRGRKRRTQRRERRIQEQGGTRAQGRVFVGVVCCQRQAELDATQTHE